MKRFISILFLASLGGCTFGGKLNNPQEALGLPNYGKPPAIRVHKGVFSANAEVSTDVDTSADAVVFDPNTGSFQIIKGKFTSNVSPLVKQLGENAVGIKS